MAETKTQKLIRPADLSEELGVDAKLIRAFLRKEFTRAADKKNTSWHLTEEMADAVRDHFIPEEDEDEAEDLEDIEDEA